MKRAALLLACLLTVSGLARADNSYELCMRSRTNAERVSRGIEPLGIDARIDKIARDHSDRMAEQMTIFHNEQLGEQLPPYEYAGENVGMGESCDAVFDAFMASPGHKANILDRDYQYIGVGVTFDSASQTVYVTLDFFSPKAQPRPPARKPPVKRTPAPCPCEGG